MVEDLSPLFLRFFSFFTNFFFFIISYLLVVVVCRLSSAGMEVATNTAAATSSSFDAPTAANAALRFLFHFLQPSFFFYFYAAIQLKILRFVKKINNRTRLSRGFWWGTLLNRLQSEMCRRLVSTNVIFFFFSFLFFFLFLQENSTSYLFGF